MINRDGYGQLDAASSAAAMAPADGQASLLPFYLVAVAAGVTVFIITKLLEGRGKRR